ncbi:hypothetical protein BGX38DRAFT_1147362 [Terfezia claveryi]|nr:hypothetical protein BGX38DRAFT_1147362 [Terfezia claveryi]
MATYLNISPPAIRHMGQQISLHQQKPSKPVQRHIFIITGPAGCGKSSVAKYLAQALDLPYIEGDDYHSEANVRKMSNGIPLTDDDRWDWLETLREKAVKDSRAVLRVVRHLLSTQAEIQRTLSERLVKKLTMSSSDSSTSEPMRPSFSSELAPTSNYKPLHEGRYGQVPIRALEEPDLTETDVIPVDVSGTLQQVQSAALDRVKGVIREQ